MVFLQAAAVGMITALVVAIVALAPPILSLSRALDASITVAAAP